MPGVSRPPSSGAGYTVTELVQPTDAARAAELHGAKLTGFWRGVTEMRPEWAQEQ